MEIKLKHIYVEKKDWQELIDHLSRAFSDGPDLNGFDGILLTTVEHKELDATRFLNIEKVDDNLRRI